MGCASSSPLVDGTVESIGTTTTEIITTTEKTVNGKLESRL